MKTSILPSPRDLTPIPMYGPLAANLEFCGHTKIKALWAALIGQSDLP